MYSTARMSSKQTTVLALVGVLALLGTVATYHSASSTTFLMEHDLLEEQEFSSYMSTFGKSYQDHEFQSRFEAYRSNMGYIRVHNSMQKSWFLRANEFTDMSNAEFKQKYLPNNYLPSMTSQEESVETFTYPQSVNWVTKGGVVTGVKNQGQCGSCWAFSTTGAVEGAWALAGHGLVSLSEQQLVDCNTQNYGCGGGWPAVAMQYIISNGGITTEQNYPYTAQNGSCNKSAASKIAASIHSHGAVSANNYPALATAVSQQPISVLVDAGGADWQSYGGGIVTDTGCGTNLDHAVLAVGYDFGSSPPYWLVKNSWGTGWGESGYIQLAIVAGNGICGVQMNAVYPIA